MWFICTTPTKSVTPLQDAPFVASTSGLFSSFFYTRYIRVYLLEYMLYTKVNFIGDPAHWLADQYLAGIVTLAQTY